MEILANKKGSRVKRQLSRDLLHLQHSLELEIQKCRYKNPKNEIENKNATIKEYKNIQNLSKDGKVALNLASAQSEDREIQKYQILKY